MDLKSVQVVLPAPVACRESMDGGRLNSYNCGDRRLRLGDMRAEFEWCHVLHLPPSLFASLVCLSSRPRPPTRFSAHPLE